MDRFLKNFATQVVIRPDTCAMSDQSGALNFSNLDRASNALCLRLKDLAGTDAVVGFARSSMIAKTIVALGCIKAGVPYLVVDPKEDPAKRQHMLETANITAMLVETSEMEDFVKDLNCTPIHFSRQDHALNAQRLHADNRLVWLEPTSGSTGKPKLVAVDRATLQHYLMRQTVSSGLTHRDKIANFGEMWLDTFLIGANTGAETHHYDLKAQGTAGLNVWMQTQGITATQTYTAAFRALAGATPSVLPKLQTVRLAGELVTRSDVAAFERITPPNARLMNFLGSTECSFVAQHVHTHGVPVSGPGLPVGQMVEGTRIDILDDDGASLPTGTTGVVVVKARHLASGYYNNPEKTKGVYWQEADGTRALNTGDLGWMSDDGQLTLVGRADDQVKIRGYSVRYSEVEAVLRQLPDITKAAVTSHVAPTGVRYLSGHYEGAPQDPATLKSAMANALPSYMVPNYFLHYEALPRTGTGKILRRALRDPAEDARSQAVPERTTWSHSEIQIAEIWEQILGHGAFDRTSDFFDVGGDSLQAMEMVLAVERICKARVGYENLVLRGASIQDIVDHVARQSPAVVTLRADDVVDEQTVPLYLLPVENSEFSPWLRLCQAMPGQRQIHGVHARVPGQVTGILPEPPQDFGMRAARAILDHAGHGDVYVAGYSAGTHTALETARALAQLGHAPRGLILLDPTLVQYEPDHRSWKWRRIFSPLFKQGDLARTVQRARHILLGGVTDELPVADETAFFAYDLKHGPVPPVQIFMSLEENPHRAAKEASWRAAVDPEAEILTVKCNHQSIVRNANAVRVAGLMASWMDKRSAQKNPADVMENLQNPLAVPAA